ncbi:MAG: VOC family protein [Candidatus Marinimicrobia bacterium]|nr:VOC family protein [Candidatus Neomarinimicrobiota bacterium]
MKNIMFILYVADQAKSKVFYQNVLQLEPVVDVPGMTEFTLENGVMIGLMPNEGIAKILGDALPHPGKGQGIPRCELYLKLDDARSYIDRALNAGATPVSPMQERPWGDTAGYVADPDGHVLAFAEE